MRIRQVALATPELEPVAEQLALVFGLEICFCDPGVEMFGLRNALLPVGDSFLELLAPLRPNTAVGRFLERRGGPGAYMVIVQTDALAADRRRIEGLGVRVVWETTLPDIATIHLHPRDVGGAIVSLDEARPPESWRWAGPGWQQHVRTQRVYAIAGVQLEAAEPLALADRWSQVLGRSPVPAADCAAAIALDASAIGFARAPQGRMDGIYSVDLAAAEGGRSAALEVARAHHLAVRDNAVAICGTWLRLV